MDVLTEEHMIESDSTVSKVLNISLMDYMKII